MLNFAISKDNAWQNEIHRNPPTGMIEPSGAPASSVDFSAHLTASC